MPSGRQRAAKDAGNEQNIAGPSARAADEIAGRNFAGQGDADHGRSVRAGQLAADHVKPVGAGRFFDPAVKSVDPALGLRESHHTRDQGKAGLAAASCHITDCATRRLPPDRRRSITGKEVPPLDHAVGLEQREHAATSAAHRGTVIADTGMHGWRRSTKQTLQTRQHRIFSGFPFHSRNMIPAMETALKTACMIIGTSKEPVFS